MNEATAHGSGSCMLVYSALSLNSAGSIADAKCLLIQSHLYLFCIARLLGLRLR